MMFPFLSDFHPLTKENDGQIDSSSKYYSPLKHHVSFGYETISTVSQSHEYFKGNPPCSIGVPRPALQ